MPMCAIKKGFFALRDCGTQTIHVCQRCYRPVCEEHSDQEMGEVICVDCLAKGHQEETLQEDDWLENPNMPYRYRHTYYTDSRYRPIYRGSHHYSYYDDYDVRSFDREYADESLDYDDDGQADFLDS